MIGTVIRIHFASKVKRLDDKYPLETVAGVIALFKNIHRLREARFTKGDYNISALLMSFEDSIQNSGLTARQMECLELVYKKDMTQEQASNVLGIARRTVNKHLAKAVECIVAYNNQTENVDISLIA